MGERGCVGQRLMALIVGQLESFKGKCAFPYTGPLYTGLTVSQNVLFVFLCVCVFKYADFESPTKEFSRSRIRGRKFVASIDATSSLEVIICSPKRD